MLHAAPQACRNTAYQTLVRPNWSTPPLPGAPKLKVRSVSWSPSRTRQPALWHTNTAHHECNRAENVPELANPLESWRNYRDCLMWYKIHHGLIHISFPDSVSQKQRLGCHDHQLAYTQICPRVETYLHSFYVQMIPLWNGLSASVATATTLPETGHVQPVWSGRTIDTPNYVLFLTCTLYLCFIFFMSFNLLLSLAPSSTPSASNKPPMGVYRRSITLEDLKTG